MEKEVGNNVSLWQIACIFGKIGAFTIGGGYAMIPLIEREVVQRGWLDDKEFPDIIALAQSAPGILAVNMSIFTGHRLKGTKGSVVATISCVFPSFLAILLIAMFMTNFAEEPMVVRMFNGIRPVVVSLIAVPMINMARKNNKTWWAWGISLATLVMVAFMNISPIWILLVIIVLSLAVTYIKERSQWKS